MTALPDTVMQFGSGRFLRNQPLLLLGKAPFGIGDVLIGFREMLLFVDLVHRPLWHEGEGNGANSWGAALDAFMSAFLAVAPAVRACEAPSGASHSAGDGDPERTA